MRRNPLFLTVLLALALVWAGCSSGPPSLSISAKNGRNGLALDAANTVELTAVIKGVEVNPDEIVWSVSDPLLAEITGSGRSVTVTGLKAGEVVVSAVYGDLEDAYKLYIFDTKPVKEVFREDFEGFDAGTPSAKAGYSFSGNTVIAAGEGGQGEKALKLTKTGENAQLRVEFGQALTKGSVSMLLKKPNGTGSFNVSLVGADQRAGFQMTNNNGLRYRTIEGTVSADTQLGTVDTNNWLRLEIVFDNDAGTYSFYQGEGGGRALIGGPVPYSRGAEGITGVEIQHAGNEGQVILVDDIAVVDLAAQGIVF